ncbi:hypothetical protein [Antarcticimicrobium sediminis]|uniref:Uncharacterized protein n=1 Tax=Antarcticimicrobium sediminis TaxID=2546227 RepID=A0A4R5EG04_9RHOB|nr:hypothetical protein [Antarcticimicrobium sediminis]TDE33184.1 hypothetical protein E1B25_21570 [Antarcticimicrobium sediminis]
MYRPTDDEAAAMIASLSPEARAAWDAVMPLIGDDSNRFIASLIEAACVTAIASGCDPAAFSAGVKTIWDDRTQAFMAPIQ